VLLYESLAAGVLLMIVVSRHDGNFMGGFLAKQASAQGPLVFESGIVWHRLLLRDRRASSSSVAARSLIGVGRDDDEKIPERHVRR